MTSRKPKADLKIIRPKVAKDTFARDLANAALGLAQAEQRVVESQVELNNERSRNTREAIGKLEDSVEAIHARIDKIHGAIDEVKTSISNRMLAIGGAIILLLLGATGTLLFLILRLHTVVPPIANPPLIGP